MRAYFCELIIMQKLVGNFIVQLLFDHRYRTVVMRMFQWIDLGAFVRAYLLSTLRHSHDDFKQAFISSVFVECGMTGSVCLKSPERSNRVPLFFMSFNVLFNASSECLYVIVHSFQMIILHCFSTVAMYDCFFMLHTASGLF